VTLVTLILGFHDREKHSVHAPNKRIAAETFRPLYGVTSVTRHHKCWRVEVIAAAAHSNQDFYVKNIKN